MTATTPDRSPDTKSRGLWSYNIRILLGNSYWLIVTPVAAAQLVLFWNMATATLFSPVRAAQTIELLAPILGAFLCAHALAPEQAGVRELVFVRPVSLEKVLLVRLGAMLAFVLAVLVPALILYAVGIEAFPIGSILLAGIPSMLFLSILALAVASATGHPLLGLAAAALYWVLDLARGTDLNALISLHGFADHLAARPMSEQWVLGKLILLGLTLATYICTRRLLGRPTAPRRWLAAVRSGFIGLLLIAVYFGSGAAYKVAYGIQHERALARHTHLWFKQQFSAYGPVPVARLFGPAFDLYVKRHGEAASSFAWSGAVFPSPAEVADMKRIVARYPDSIWADNAAFEIAGDAGRDIAPNAWSLIVHYADERPSDSRELSDGLAAGAAEFRRFADTYPTSPFTPLALDQTAAMSLSLLDFQSAVTTCERLLEDYPDAPETRSAGLGLSALYLRQGRWQEAVRAADIAAAASSWDLRGEALLTAARAAERAGQGPEARTRYEQAHAAAKEARRRSSARQRGAGGMTGGMIVLRSDSEARACEQALAGELKTFTPSPPPPTSQVTGRVLRNAAGVEGIRIVLASDLDSNGRPSPFLETPTVLAETGPDGAFTLRDIPPGDYSIAAFARFQSRSDDPLDVSLPALPIRIGASPVSLPPITIVPYISTSPRTPPQIRPGSPTAEQPQAGGGPRSGSRGPAARDGGGGRGGDPRGGGTRGGGGRGGGVRGGGGGSRGGGGRGGGDRAPRPGS